MKNDIRQYVRNAINFLRKKFSGKNEDLSYYILIISALVVFVLGLNFFIELTDSLTGRALKGYDRKVTDFVISFRTPQLNKIFQFITDAGDLYGYIIATSIAAIFFFLRFRNWKIILELLVVTILAALSNIALKKVINRARPDIEHLVVVESLSYPSGHAMSAMAFYGFLIYLSFRIKIAKWLRFLVCFLCVFLILGIGISRIYLGVHFPSDVLGGFTAGLIWIAFCVILFNILDLLRKKKSKDLDLEEEEKLEA